MFVRTQYNIYDGAFLRKWLTAFSQKLFSEKSSIADVWLFYKLVSWNSVDNILKPRKILSMEILVESCGLDTILK